MKDPVRTSTSTGTCSNFVMDFIAVADYGAQGLASLRLGLWFTMSFSILLLQMPLIFSSILSTGLPAYVQ